MPHGAPKGVTGASSPLVKLCDETRNVGSSRKVCRDDGRDIAYPSANYSGGALQKVTSKLPTQQYSLTSVCVMGFLGDS